ncbi:MAG: OB-fold nucleic acid binding domain-containing protein [Thermoprotei archaeon]
MKIVELDRGGLRQVNVVGELVDIGEVRTVNLRAGGQSRVADAVLQDDSGAVDLTLWDNQVDEFSVGDKVQIQNGYTSEFRGRVKLNVGRYGKITKITDDKITDTM